MARGETRLFIERPAVDIAEFVLDLRGYAKVDNKLGRIFWVRREGNEVTFRFLPKLLGLPGPPTTQKVVLSPDGTSITVSGVPSWTDRMVAFAAMFTFDERDGGTWVTRQVQFTFAKPLAKLIDKRFERWLDRDVRVELEGAKRALES
jgi:hypothetical protein